MDLALLEKIAKNEVQPFEAYVRDEARQLNLKKGRFVRFRLQSPEMPRMLNGIFRMISGIPLPLAFAQVALRRVKTHQMHGWDVQDIKLLLQYAKGIKIKIETDDVNLAITVH